MTQLDEAISRYNKLLETGPYRDLAWAHELQARMEAERLTSGGRLLCPFLRPNLVMRRQYDPLVKVSELLISAIDRMQQMVLASPAPITTEDPEPVVCEAIWTRLFCADA